MASADHLKALLKSHLDGDDARFFSVAMQVAAHEAKLGHGKLAEELRALVDRAKARRGLQPQGGEKAIPINRPRGELSGLLAVTYPKARLAEMVLDEDLSGQLKRIIREQRQAAHIRAHGLSPRRKLLLMGAARNRQDHDRISARRRTGSTVASGTARWAHHQVHG